MKKLALFAAILFAALCAAWLVGPFSSGSQAMVSRVLVHKAAHLLHRTSLSHAAPKTLLARPIFDSEVPL